MSSGAELAGVYSRALVEPLLERALPALRFSTARLGSGSDVLGYDDAMSRDHDWGLRLTVVVPEPAVAAVAALLEAELPDRFAEQPVRFATSWDPVVRQRAEVVSASGLSTGRTGVDATRPRSLLDHVSLTGQAVLEVTAGPVFRDDDGVLRRLRSAFEPPSDVRLWAIASAWQRLAEELPFIGRAGERGDAHGSGLVASRLSGVAVRLAFHLAGRPAPYSKWLGSAFAALDLPDGLEESLRLAARAEGWATAEAALVAGLELLAAMQAREGILQGGAVTERFWARPYRGLRPVAQEVQGRIADDAVRALPLIGPPDLWTDDVRILTDHALRRRATAAMLGLDGA